MVKENHNYSVYGHGWHRDCVWSTATEPGDIDGGILGLAFEISSREVHYHLRQAFGGLWNLNDTSLLEQYIEQAGGYESYAIIIQFIGEQMSWDPPSPPVFVTMFIF